MPSLLPNMRCTLLLSCCLLLCQQRAFGQTDTPAQIVEMHRLAEKLINYDQDSCFALLERASKKISSLQNPRHIKALTAENQLRRADYWIFRDAEKGRIQLSKALHYYKAHPDNKKLAEAYILKGQLYKSLQRNKVCVIATSMLYFDTASSYASKQADAFTQMAVYYEQALSLQQMERWQESFEKAYLALEAATRSGDSLALAATHFLLSRTYNYFGLPNRSETYLEKSIAYGKGTTQIAYVIHTYACTLLQNKKIEQALVQYNKALELHLARGDTNQALILLTQIGRGQLQQDRITEANITYHTMRRLLSTYGGDSTKTLLFSAQMHLLQGDSSKALLAVNAFDHRFKRSTFRGQSLDLYKDVADIYLKLGLPLRASAYYKKWGDLKDSLRTYTSRLQLGELEKMYLSERFKTRQISKSNTALRESKQQQALMAGILIAVILIGVSAVYAMRIRSVKESQALKYKLKEKQLSQLMEAQETERQRLARELHDGIGQSLAALKMQLQLDDQPKASHITVNRVNALCKEVRSLSHQMMPLALKEKGLKSAIEQLIEYGFTAAGIQVDLVTSGLNERLPSKVEVHLYRIMQELTTNILRHAQATEVGIQLLHQHTHVLLIVEDNGVGFSTERKTKGMGLSNIHSRLEALSGRLELQSSYTDGTYVRIAVPLSAQRRTA